MAHPVRSVHESVSMTRSTKTTIRIGSNFEIVLLTWSPLTESNRRPSPYHRHGRPPRAPCPHRKPAQMLGMPRMHRAITAPFHDPFHGLPALRRTPVTLRNHSALPSPARPAIWTPGLPVLVSQQRDPGASRLPRFQRHGDDASREGGSELAAQMRDGCHTAV